VLLAVLAVLVACTGLLLPTLPASGAPGTASVQAAVHVSSHPAGADTGESSWHGDHAVPPRAGRPTPVAWHAAPAGGTIEPSCPDPNRPPPTALRVTEPAHVATPRLLSHDTGRAPPPPART
jgi:hypothetical protein